MLDLEMDVGGVTETHLGHGNQLGTAQDHEESGQDDQTVAAGPCPPAAAAVG